MSNRLEQIVKLRFAGVEAETKPVAKEPINLADYPWDECIADQVARYGDEETAARICGWIKANYQTNFAEGEGLENACWPGYVAIGTKELDGKTVPNCVPEDKVQQSKEAFVIPTPEQGEDEQKYISRCMDAIGSEYDTQEQALAVCYSQLEK